MKQKNIYTPYTYYLQWTGICKQYYGVRYAKKTKCLYSTGCHPDDLLVTYPTSSRYVHELLREHGMPDVVEIRKTFSRKEDAIEWERKFIRKSGIIHLDEWLNRSDGRAVVCEYTEELLEKRRAHRHSSEVRSKMSRDRKGRMHTEESKQKMSESSKGKPSPRKGQELSEDTKRKISIAAKKRVRKTNPFVIILNNDKRWRFECVKDAKETLNISGTTLTTLLRDGIFTYKKDRSVCNMVKGDTLALLRLNK